MKHPSARILGLIVAVSALCVAPRIIAQGPPGDFGRFIEQELREHSDDLFGIERPLSQSALGPFTGANSVDALVLADGLRASLVSSAAHFSTDQIAFWPDDVHPAYLFVCDESSSNPSVQRINLGLPAGSNATTVVTGLSACDPVRRTPWGSILVGEEASDGGVYELLDPGNLSVPLPINVTSRTLGTTSDATHLVKRQALGALAFEGLVILADGTTYYGDELRPASGVPGGAIYKFVPTNPYTGGGVQITIAINSPLAGGTRFGLRVGGGTAGNVDWGQGTEIGQGTWVPITQAADGNGNINMRTAQAALKLTGYYRPEDMDQDPIAASRGIVRACWTNTGRMSNGGGSEVETASTYGEVMCLVDAPDALANTHAIPTVQRFLARDRQANFFDNIDFQPHTGNMVVLEDGEVSVVKNGVTELRGNDIWMCLPDGRDRDVQSDGCIRIASLRDTDSEPTGFIFTGSGKTAYVSLQHRSTGVGAILKITGFKVDERNDRCDRDGDHDWERGRGRQ